MGGFSKAELRALLHAAKAKRERDWLMFLVAYTHALRASELLSLTAKNIENGHLVVQRLKGSLRTIQPLLTNRDPLFDERNALIEWAKKSNPGDPIFSVTRQRFWQLVREYGNAIGIARHKLHPHSFRHSCALHSIKKAGVENVRQYLGHRSMSSTGEYLRVSDEEASAAVTKALKRRF
jgi:integrase/recombinase XerD